MRVDVLGWLGLSMRRHAARLLPLAGVAVFLGRVFAPSFPRQHALGAVGVGGGGGGGEGGGVGSRVGVLIAGWLLLLAHPLLVCLCWARCSKCGNWWGCGIGGGVVQELMSECAVPWGSAAAWQLGDRDSVNWPHVEHPMISALLVVAATGLSLVVVWIAAGISKFLTWKHPATVTPSASGTATCTASRWWALTALAVVLGGLHPVLACMSSFLAVSSMPDTAKHSLATTDGTGQGLRTQATRAHETSAHASRAYATAQHNVDGLRALLLLCIILRMPGLVALIRCLVISANGSNARLAVYYQDRLGPSLESFSAGPLGEGVGWAVSIDILVCILLPVAARFYSSRARAVGHGLQPLRAQAGWRILVTVEDLVDRMWSGLSALAIVLAQEDVYVVMWITCVLFLFKAAMAGAVMRPGPLSSSKHE
jgi:hypothetical protein